jgi:hypothetical protein
MKGTEVREQRSEVRGQKSEIRGQRTEVRDQRSAKPLALTTGFFDNPFDL